MCVCVCAAVKQLEVSQLLCYKGTDDIMKTLLSSKQGIFFFLHLTAPRNHLSL